MTSLKTNLIQTAKITTLGLVVGLGVNFLFAYTGPLSSPPICNAGDPGCDAPINVGVIEQTRIGRLNLIDLFAGNLNVTTKLTIPTGAGVNKVLTSDATGVATWQTPVSPTASGGFTKMVVLDYVSAAGNTADVTGGNGSYTFRVPTGVTKVKVRAWGAGGQGYCSVNGGVGGGGGGYGEGIYTVSENTNYTIQVGYGVSDLSANNGKSSFGSLIVSNPGGSANQTNIQIGGTGGTSDGQFNITGEPGSKPQFRGGSSPMGGTLRVVPGGGGYGSSGPANCANNTAFGAHGRVVVEY